MTRYLYSVFIICSLFIGTALANVYVNTEITVSGDFVKLGDVFQGVSDNKATEIVCAAPEAGKNLTITSEQLRFLSLNHNLKWQPSDPLMTVAVTRASRTYSEEEILAMIEEKILPTLSTKYNHLLSLDRRHPEIIVPMESQDEVVCAEVKVKGTRFQARFEPKNGQAVVIGGRIQSLVEVPTLVRQIAMGEIIQDDDIEMAEASQAEVRGRVIMDREALVGTTPKHRPLPPGKVVKVADVQKPTLIHRGKLVGMSYKSGALAIAGTGKALQNGSMGDIIRIMNTESRKVVQGLVTGPGQVEVGVYAS